MTRVGKHAAVPASSGETPPRESWSAEGRHSTGEFSRGELDLPDEVPDEAPDVVRSETPDEPIELLAEPLAEELHEPLAATAVPPAATERPRPHHRLDNTRAEAAAPADPPAPAPRPAGARRAANHTAPRRSHRPGRGRRLATYALAAVATALAWGVLVYYAIQLGPDVKDGEPQAWALMIVATVGAMACLFLSLILGGRVVEVLRSPVVEARVERPMTPPGGRRAKR
jgi:hypothetical protein